MQHLFTITRNSHKCAGKLFFEVIFFIGSLLLSTWWSMTSTFTLDPLVDIFWIHFLEPVNLAVCFLFINSFECKTVSKQIGCYVQNNIINTGMLRKILWIYSIKISIWTFPNFSEDEKCTEFEHSHIFNCLLGFKIEKKLSLDRN
jgi:hypothetical protein